VRSRLLLRGNRRNRDIADFDLELRGGDAGTRSGPVLGRELEVSVPRRVWQDVDDLGEVSLGVELVQLAGRDERQEVGGPPSAASERFRLGRTRSSRGTAVEDRVGQWLTAV
jgi:hypothetical protein